MCLVVVECRNYRVVTAYAITSRNVRCRRPLVCCQYVSSFLTAHKNASKCYTDVVIIINSNVASSGSHIAVAADIVNVLLFQNRLLERPMTCLCIWIGCQNFLVILILFYLSFPVFFIPSLHYLFLYSVAFSAAISGSACSSSVFMSRSASCWYWLVANVYVARAIAQAECHVHAGLFTQPLNCHHIGQHSACRPRLALNTTNDHKYWL